MHTVRIFTLKNLGRKLKFTLAKLSNIITPYRTKPKLRNDRPIRNFMLNSSSLRANALWELFNRKINKFGFTILELRIKNTNTLDL